MTDREEFCRIYNSAITRKALTDCLAGWSKGIFLQLLPQPDTI